MIYEVRTWSLQLKHNFVYVLKNTFPKQIKVASSQSWEDISDFLLQVVKTCGYILRHCEASNFGLLIPSFHQKCFHSK